MSLLIDDELIVRKGANHRWAACPLQEGLRFKYLCLQCGCLCFAQNGDTCAALILPIQGAKHMVLTAGAAEPKCSYVRAVFETAMECA